MHALRKKYFQLLSSNSTIIPTFYWTISLSLYLSQLDEFFHGISEAAYAVPSMAESS